MRRTRTTLLLSLATLAAFALGCATKSNDAQLATTIKAEMFSDPQTKDSGLQVAVKDGVVTLSGTVPSDAARYEAYKLATTTPESERPNRRASSRGAHANRRSNDRRRASGRNAGSGSCRNAGAPQFA